MIYKLTTVINAYTSFILILSHKDFGASRDLFALFQNGIQIKGLSSWIASIWYIREEKNILDHIYETKMCSNFCYNDISFYLDIYKNANLQSKTALYNDILQTYVNIHFHMISWIFIIKYTIYHSHIFNNV